MTILIFNVLRLLYNVYYFIDKPGAPEGPLAVSDVFADMCRLSWNPPTDNGGAEVTGKYLLFSVSQGSALKAVL